MRLDLRLARSGVFLCAPLIPIVSFAQNIANDPIRAHLLTLGKRGLTVTLARDRVIEILESENSCSTWFQEADPKAASTFPSLKFIIDATGPQGVLELQSHSGGMLMKHPYAALIFVNGQGKPIVMLNAKGAFFVASAVVWRQENFVGPFHPSGWRNLRVGPYFGDTLAAQVTILLHEFGHLVGRLPDDSDELSGQSERNTAEVLRSCRIQIDAAIHSMPAQRLARH
jgi:hypothetical protein